MTTALNITSEMAKASSLIGGNSFANEVTQVRPTELLKVQNLCKVFGPSPAKAMEMLKQGMGRNEIFEQTGNMVAVDNVSLSVMQGEIFVIMGLSGSGKSTLVRLLNRLIEPTSGQVILEGKDIAPMSTEELREVRRKKMSMVFQSFALLPNRTVIDNVCYGLQVSGISKSDRYEVARKVLSRVGLGKYETLYPGELSGGMQQRVGLARALAVNPSVLLMDEAFSALDPLIRFEMQNELLRLQKDEQRTIVFISHDIEEAIKIGGRVGVMKDGQLVQVGTPAELIQSPANDYVRDFFRNVDVSRFLKANSLLVSVHAGGKIVCDESASADRFADQLIDAGAECGYVCNNAGKYIGCVTPASLRKAGQSAITNAFLSDVFPVSIKADLHELSHIALQQEHDVPITDENGGLAGVISCRAILKQVMQRREA